MIQSQYFSQNGQDKFLNSLFKRKKNGFFIDVGAYDGKTFSNTYFLEKFLGWSGICIEPNPLPYEKLVKVRNCITHNCGIGSQEKSLKFISISGYGEMLSGFRDSMETQHLERIDNSIKLHGGSKKELDIPVKALQSIIDVEKCYEIDYCNIDVEGGEMEVLRSIDFSKTKIKLLSVENNYGGKDVLRFLRSIGYSLITRIGADDFYELNSRNYKLMLEFRIGNLKRRLSKIKHLVFNQIRG